jgi:hypothetical protein
VREASARQALAEVATERGDVTGARGAFEQACVALGAEASALEAPCRGRFAVALLGWGSPREAMAQVEQAESVTARREPWLPRRELDVQASLVRGAVDAGARATSRERLAAIVAEADGAGAVRDALEASLALAEVELADGRTRDGHARLARVARDATARGFVGLARQASTLR